MDIGIPATKTEARVIIGMVQYYWVMWRIRLNVLTSLKKADGRPKGSKLLCNNKLDVSYKELNKRTSS